MLRFRMAVRLFLAGFVAMIIGLGCSSGAPKVSVEEQAKLDEARVAAESAERKLAELRQERILLEQGLNGGEAPEEEQPTQ